MKSKLFKKVIAGAVTAAMASQVAFVLPAFADELALEPLTQDFTVTATRTDKTIVIPVTNNTAAAAKVSVYVAEYDAAGQLVGIKAADKDVAAGASEEISITYTAAAGNEVKLFLWNGQTPIVKAVELEEGTVPTAVPTVIPTTEPTTPPTIPPTTEPTATPTATPEPYEYLYTQDYEKVADITAGWTSYNTEINTNGGPLITLETDAGTASKYIKFATGSGAGGLRTVSQPFDAAAKVTDGKSVLEFDLAMNNSSGDRANEFMILASSGKPQTNTTYQQDAYILKFDQLKAQGDRIIINEQALGDNADSSTAVNVTTNYTNNAWAHVKAILDFTEKTVVLKMTSLDGQTTYFDGKVNMGASADSLGYIVAAPSRNGRGSIGLDNIKVRKADAGDITDVYYTITYQAGDADSSESVKNGESPATVPEAPYKSGTPGQGGYVFKGWQKDQDESTIYTTEQVKAMQITADTTFTAIFDYDESIIEKLEGISFKVKPDAIPAIPTEAEATVDLPIELSLTGEWGGDLTLPANQTGELNVEWSVDGFDVKDGVSVGDKPNAEGSATTGDSYILLSGFKSDSTKANINVRAGVGNYYGRITAKVTYGDENNGYSTYTQAFPVAILSDTSKDVNRIYPLGGYPTNLNYYSDDLVGYRSTSFASNSHNPDPLLSGWNGWGSMGETGAVLAKDENGDKYLSMTSGSLGGASSYVANNIGTHNEQIIIETDIAFPGSVNSSYPPGIEYIEGTVHTSGTKIAIRYDGNSFGTIQGVTGDTWYRMKISYDTSTRTYWYKIYTTEGQLVGESDVLAYPDEVKAPTSLVFQNNRIQNQAFKIKNMTIYKPELDSFTISSEDTVTIPETDSTQIDLTAIMKDASGADLSGIVEWSLEENVDGVTVAANANDTSKATLTVTKDAPTGEVTVIAANRGRQAQKKITLTGSADNVAFVNPTTSITIPMDEGGSVEATYTAEVRNGEGTAYPDKSVTYALYNKTNTEPAGQIQGVSFDSATAKLTVDATAKAQILYLRATSTNSEGATIMRAIKLNIHGMLFDFGAGLEDDLADGYTAVTPSTIYSDDLGYGLESAGLQVGGSASADPLDGDYLEGANIVFKAKVPAGKNYKVKVTYKGELRTEKVTSNAIGVARTANETLASAEYEVPVVDGVLDLNLASAQIASVSIEKMADKEKTEKPTWYTYGDSTTNSNTTYISWGNVAEPTKYNLKNTARGGRNHVSYYNEGIFDSILNQVRPGDLVTFNGMGTNGYGGDTQEEFKQMIKYAILGVQQRGAEVVIVTYTPHGPVKSDKWDYTAGYNKETQIFKANRDNDGYTKVYREVAEELNLPLIDLGHLIDDKFNEMVKEARDAVKPEATSADTEAWAAGEEKAQWIISQFPDHNHYFEPLAKIFAEIMVTEVEKSFPQQN